jgi:nicotinamidase-related amidase
MQGISAVNKALLVIDMQRDFCAPGGYAAQAGLDISLLRAPIAAIQRLLNCARGLGLLVLHTREGHRPDLADLPEAKRRRAEQAGAPIGSQGPLGRLLVRGEYGHELIDELQPLPGEPVIDKPGYSAFASTDLDLLLRNRGISELLICGVTTEVCVSSTLRSAVDLGYACTLVSDACGSAYPQLHAAALAMVDVEGGVFGRVCDSQQLIGELENCP